MIPPIPDPPVAGPTTERGLPTAGEMPAAPRLTVPSGLVVASEITWRCLILAVPIAGLLWLADYLAIVVIPVVVSLFLAAILEPVRRLLLRHLSPRWSAALAFLFGVLVAATLVTLAVTEITSNFKDLVAQTNQGVERISRWLSSGPLKLRSKGLQRAISDSLTDFGANPKNALSGALSVVSTTGGLLAGTLLALISTVFMLFDRERIVRGIVSVAPLHHRERTNQSLRASWEMLVAYVKVTLTEALFDSFLIGLATFIVGVPVAFALTAVVFLSVFVPTVGAIVSGLLVVLVALVTKGPTAALVIGAVVLVVQQVDANLLYPLLTSRRLSIHPLASILLVAAGGVLGGLFGAFVAVPLVAMLLAAVGEFRRPPVDADEVPAL